MDTPKNGIERNDMAIPVLDRPNAFNSDEGTIFTYTVSGVPSIIRSTKVTVYDSDNNKLLSHLFVSVQTRHELPAKTDSSIVYEVGKSSADFVNGRQYSAEIDIYDTVDASGESLGKSNRVSFWCFETPSIEFTYPKDVTSVSSTSFNFVATVNVPYPIEASVVQNKVQSYIFDLYKGSYVGGVLVGSSGTLYGTGTPISNNKYSLSYTFNGLSDNTDYFVELNIITEQGMTARLKSSNIITSLEESSISIAEVENSPCEGCIYISSNITNIVGDTSASFTPDSGHIDLTGYDKYVTWGGNGLDLVFPIISDEGMSTSRWGMILKVKNMNYSDKNHNTHNNEYLLKLTDAGESSCVYLFPRQQGDNTWIDLYATRLNDDNVGVGFIMSNVLSGVTSDTELYILVNCYSGLYEVSMATSL